MAFVAPALLAADLARLGEALRMIEAAGCRMVHIDVGDGHFARDVTVGQPVIESIRKATRLELDLHLLIERPERYVAEFVQAGADRLAIHPESTPHPHYALKLIRSSGAKAGVALAVGTPLNSISDLLPDVDFLNILTAEPDWGPKPASGSKESELIPAQLDKLSQICQLRERLGLHLELQVEGGLTAWNIKEVAQTGADILVARFDIFDNQDPLARLRDAIRAASCDRPGTPVESESSAGGISSIS
ncbi:MAG TPA: ribulose-phosphate 3-epimerase [Terriglobia bacterium]|nr:ribulose-phosphate 3-epimerase [Terriglobia bacterium]